MYLAVTNRRPRHEDEEPRVLQVIPVAGAMSLPNATRYHPGVNVTVQTTPSRTNADGTFFPIPRMIPRSLCGFLVSVLHVRLHGGYYMGARQKADFQFLCDRDVEEVSASLPSDPPTFALNTPQTPTALVPETLLVMERHTHLQLAHQTRLRLAARREACTPRRPSPRLRGRRPR